MEFCNDKMDDLVSKSNYEEDFVDSNSIRAYAGWLEKLGRPILTHEEEIECIKRIKQGDCEAWKYFIECNLGLVFIIYKKYSGLGLSDEDLIAEGNMALLKSVELFDLDKGCKFSTYAVNVINRYICRALECKGTTLKYSSYFFDKFKKINMVKKKLGEKLNREPTNEEIADFLEISVDKVDFIETHSDSVLSLEAFLKEDNDSVDCFLADKNISVEDTVCDNVMVEDVDRALEKTDLTEMERDIVKLRFGFAGGKIHTLEEIGDFYGLTKERIRQREREILDKVILDSGCIEKLLGYFIADTKELKDKVSKLKEDARNRRYKKRTKRRVSRDYQAE